MAQSRIKNTSKNLIYAIILQVVTLSFVFIVRVIFVKQLGASYLGISGLFSNILSVLSLADLGMTTVLMYSLYKPLAENNQVKISQYINYFKKVYTVIAIVVAILGVALIPFLKYVVNLPEEMPNIYLYYILILANSVISYLFVYKTTLVSADQKMYIITKYNTIFQFILFFLQISILLFTSNFALYLTSNIVCTLLSNIFKVKKTEQIYPFLKKYKSEKLPKEDRKNLFTNLYSLFFYKLGAVMQNNIDNILISIFAGTITVGYYSNYSTIILYVTSFLTLIFTSLKASVGNYIVTNNKKEQLKMYNILEMYNFWIVAFCSICFIVLIPDFIQIFFGEEYILGYSLLIIVVLNFYTSNIRQTLWIYRETTGMFTKTKHITIVTSLVNFVFSIILGYFYGLLGVLGATLIANMIYSWWKEPILTYKEYYNTSSKPYFITYIKRIILAIILCFITYASCNLLPTNTSIYINFIFKMCLCLIIPNLIILLIYRKSDAFSYLKTTLLKLKERN